MRSSSRRIVSVRLAATLVDLREGKLFDQVVPQPGGFGSGEFEGAPAQAGVAQGQEYVAELRYADSGVRVYHCIQLGGGPKAQRYRRLHVGTQACQHFDQSVHIGGGEPFAADTQQRR